MFRILTVALALSLLTTTAFAQKGKDKKKLNHPHLHAALHELREARQELDKSTAKFGGKKKQALAAIDDALTSLKLILAVKGDNFKGIDRDTDHYKKHKDHPHIRAALEDLRDARRELNDAKADFGGNKKKALKDIDFAIDKLKDLLDAVK